MSQFVYGRRFAGALAGLFLAGGFALSAADEASAATSAPTQCVVRTYFKEAAHIHEVGQRTNCPGMDSWGRTSAYVESEVITFDQPTPPPPPTGGFPCEFQRTGCGPAVLPN